MEIRLTKSRETFHFKQPISIEGSWRIGFLSLEVYNPFFNITEENKKLELHTDTFDEFSFQELRDELEQILNIPDKTSYHLDHNLLGPRIFRAYKEIRIRKIKHWWL